MTTLDDLITRANNAVPVFLSGAETQWDNSQVSASLLFSGVPFQYEWYFIKVPDLWLIAFDRLYSDPLPEVAS